eukprot:c20610_g1_i8 orf=1593-1829(+)
MSIHSTSITQNPKHIPRKATENMLLLEERGLICELYLRSLCMCSISFIHNHFRPIFTYFFSTKLSPASESCKQCTMLV